MALANSPIHKNVETRSSARSPYKVKVLDRTVQILDVLAAAKMPLGPAELAARVSLHRSTVHRLLRVLERHRLIRKDGEDGKYSLGMRLFELGTQVVTHLDLARRAMPFLRGLADATNETAHICVRSGGDMVSVANVEGPWALRAPVTVGRRTPLHCTSTGKAYLACLSEADLDHLLTHLPLTRYTARTIVTVPALKAEIARVRAARWAMDAEEFEDGLRCIGVVVRDHTGAVAGAISIAGPAFRLTDERMPAVVRAVLSAADGLSRDIGFTGAPPSSSPASAWPRRTA